MSHVVEFSLLLSRMLQARVFVGHKARVSHFGGNRPQFAAGWKNQATRGEGAHGRSTDAPNCGRGSVRRWIPGSAVHVRSAALSDLRGQWPLPDRDHIGLGGSFTNGFIGPDHRLAVDTAIRITFSGIVVRVPDHRARCRVRSTEVCAGSASPGWPQPATDPPPPPEKWGDQESENASSGSAVSTADSEGARSG